MGQEKPGQEKQEQQALEQKLEAYRELFRRGNKEPTEEQAMQFVEYKAQQKRRRKKKSVQSAEKAYQWFYKSKKGKCIQVGSVDIFTRGPRDCLCHRRAYRRSIDRIGSLGACGVRRACENRFTGQNRND